MEPHNIVDLATYPIDDLDTPAAQELIAACRRDLDERALCLLPGFIKPDAILQMAAQAAAANAAGHHYECLRTPYSFMCNQGFTTNLPKNLP